MSVYRASCGCWFLEVTLRHKLRVFELWNARDCRCGVCRNFRCTCPEDAG